MGWKKLGHVFSPDGSNPVLRTHAALPIARHRKNNVFEVFYSARDEQQRSSVGRLLLEIGESLTVLHVDEEPILRVGALGCFDDSGVMLSSTVETEERDYFYYIGWNRGVTVPFRNAIGLALSQKDGHISRYAEGPILDRSTDEPHFVSSPTVVKLDGVWRMWYLACTEWRLIAEQPKHYYHIRSAESDDGIVWRRHGHVAIDFSSPDEYAISRPSVVKDEDCWRMWYSFRGDAYRIGYAESADGVNWQRRDCDAGLDVSESGWDSEMIEYPFVFDHLSKRYMLYNGNGYGHSGFGMAVWEA